MVNIGKKKPLQGWHRVEAKAKTNRDERTFAMGNSNTRAYDVIADRILDLLDKGEVPWRKPWSLQPGMRPQNAVSKRPYSGINSMMLGLSGYGDTRWLTFRGAQQLGGNVRKGEKATPITFWKQFKVKDKDENGETVEKIIPLLKYFSVFNVEQCEGLDLPPIETAKPFNAIEAAEKIIANMPNRPSIDHDGGDRAYYIPSLDTVHLPSRTAFGVADEYYSTAFHELGHSTGHTSRLNRHGLETGIAPFGSETYSKEELAAEFASAFLCNESGIENTIDNSAAYIRGWSKVIRKDKRLVVQAASQGQKAADFILG